jgi:two-component system chemotaxis sensor kinase CheA
VTELLDVRAAILAADPAFYSTHPAALPPPVPESAPAPLLEV